MTHGSVPPRAGSTFWAQLRGRVDLLTAVVALTAALVSAGVVLPWVAPSRQPARPTRITTPGEYVRQTENLAGELGDLPRGTQVWAVTRDMASGRFYPQDHPCEVLDDQFRCGDYWIGPDGQAGGRRYTIYLVAAPARAVGDFLHYQEGKGGTRGADPGMDELPAEATVLAHQDVVRTPN